MAKRKRPAKSSRRTGARAAKASVAPASEFQQAEQWLDATSELQQALDRFVLLFNEASIGYLTLDERGRIVDINPRAAEFLRSERVRLTGKSLLPFIFRADIKAFSAHLLGCVSGAATTELRLARGPAGSPRQVRLTSRSAVDGRRAQLRFYTIITDIEEERRNAFALQQTAKRHREIVETANEGICIVNPGDEIVFANQRLGAMIGLPGEALIGRSAHELLHEEDVQRMNEPGTAPVDQIDQRLCRVDGTTLHVSMSQTEMRDEHGRVTGTLRMYTDATARHELAATREEFVRQMVAAQENERQRIARELHDQLGQHIVGLSLGLARLSTLTTDAEASAMITLLRRAAELLAKDVHTLAMELRPSALDHLGLAEAVRSYAEEIAERSGLEIDFHSDTIDDFELSGAIQTGLYRIAQEALTNIVKHARAQHVSVLIERHADAVQLIVEDDGRGFESNKLHRIDGKLGLAGMRERAAIIGGTVTIESALRKGTTIYVRVPVTPRSNEHDQKTTTAAG
jgi:PAS domain S-box-containing protein